ncbi:conserved Plasmodium protein, unknown function [Plasmodium relictum]|uniref:PIPK domain-containing protein n=1 Tax=Plasmodium relictum TaxID=85471 RepID=A0A1J1HIC7_PLARL|nr:conserved Plasmodium protein, unknown function [Plasmodium relictum]CRH04013.1 conserved Plasmodium protein, unknown function [Plasmodium relictum]
MEKNFSEKYVSFQNNPKQLNASQKIFEWIFNYPLFNEIRNTNLSNQLGGLEVKRHIHHKELQTTVKKKNSKNSITSFNLREYNELTTNLIKNEITTKDYSLINNNKFYINIIKKSEKIYNGYYEKLKNEKKNKLIFEKAKEKYLRKKKGVREDSRLHIILEKNINKEESLLLKEKFNPFFNFFGNENKNIYHSSINFSLKTNIQLNKYFYKVILNQLNYYNIKKDIYINILNIVNEISKYYYSYDYDILNNIKIKYFPYKKIGNSFYINGLVFSNCSIYFNNVEIENPKILLLDTKKKIKYEKLENYYSYNYNYYLWKNLSNRFLNIILIHGELDFYIKKLLINKKIYFFTSIKKKNMYRLSNILRVQILNYENFLNFDNSYVAKANYFKIQKYKKNVKNIFLSCSNKFLTICIFGKKEISENVLVNENENSDCSNIQESNIKNRTKNTTIFDDYFKREVEKENILDNFINVYYINKNDDYVIDYFFLNKEKKISFSGKEKRENKKNLLINHLKNVIIIKKIKKILKFVIFLSFYVYKQIYLNNYMDRTLISLSNENINTIRMYDKNYNNLNFLILYSSFFFIYPTKKKITPINLMSNLFHLLNIKSPLKHERINILYKLVNTKKIIKEQIYNNYEYCFFSSEKNKVIDIVNFFLFNNFMKNYESNCEYIFYYLKIINNTYLYYNHKNIIMDDSIILNRSNLLSDMIPIDQITVKNKINEKVENIIAENILFYSYDFLSSKNIEMIIYFICPNYIFINNLYNNINIYLFDNQSNNSKKLFYNFFFNYKYIYDISIQQFIYIMHSLSFKLKCPFDLCRNYLCYHQICIQIFLKKVLIIIKKEKNDNLEDNIVLNIICNKCYCVNEKNINLNFSFSEFLLCIIHSDNYINRYCNHNGKYNSYALYFKNVKIIFQVHDNNIYKSINPFKTIRMNKSSNEEMNNNDAHNNEMPLNYINKNKSEKKLKNYIKKNIKNIIHNNVFYYYPCKCLTKRYNLKKKKKKEKSCTSFNLYSIIENFPKYNNSMLPMYSSLKFLIYNYAVKYYRSKNKHLYMKTNEKIKKENFHNPCSPLYFKNQCKKCKYIKISNFSTLVFFNSLFVIKRIFYNFYSLISFLIDLLNKNIFIKINEIRYILNNRTSCFIDDNFLSTKGDLKKKNNNQDSIGDIMNNEFIGNKEVSISKTLRSKSDKLSKYINDVDTQNFMNKNDEEINNNTIEINNKYIEIKSREITNSDTNLITSESYSNIIDLEDYSKKKKNLIKEYLLFKKLKNVIRHYKKYLIKVLINFYFYGIVNLTKKKFSLEIEIFFSYYIMILEKINIEIQKNIEYIEELRSKEKLEYLHFTKNINKKLKSFIFDFNKKEKRKKKGNKKKKYIYKLVSINEENYSHLNPPYNTNSNKIKKEKNNFHYFSCKNDIAKLYIKEKNYIYNIENYRRKKNIYFANKEDYENENKKPFYLHISKIVKEEKKNFNNKKTKGKKKRCIFIFKPNDTSNIIFHSLISNNYKKKLKEIYEKEKKVIFEEDNISNNCKKITTKKNMLSNKKKKYPYKVHYNDIEKYLNKSIQKLHNNFYDDNVKDFLNCKNNDMITIFLSNNICVYIYFPIQFHYLRKFLCEKEIYFLKSLKKSNYINFDYKKKNFAKTYDSKYIIKEINRHEFKSFFNKFKEFFQHFSDIFFKFKKSLLCFMYGLYQIEIKKKNKKTVKTYIILENVRINNKNSKILIFDIKGARKKKNLQNLLMQNNKKSSFFEKREKIPLNTTKIKEEEYLSGNKLSDISMNLKYLTKYLRKEKKKINKYNHDKTEEHKNIYNRNSYLDFLLLARSDKLKGKKEGEKEKEMGKENEKENKDKKKNELRRTKINEKGSDMKKKNRNNEKCSNNINEHMNKEKKMNGNSNTNQERINKFFKRHKKKILNGYYSDIKSLKNYTTNIKLKKNIFNSKEESTWNNLKKIDKEENEMNKKRTQKNDSFLKEMVQNIKMYIFLNHRILKIKKKKKNHKIKFKKNLNNKCLYNTKLSLHFLSKKKEQILNKENLNNYKIKHKNTSEETYDLLYKEPNNNKNFESSNSIEKYNHFTIDNYNTLRNYYVLFDDNFKDFIKAKVINLEYIDYKYLIDSLKNDTNFLSSHDIMDYSLLIHIDISNFQIAFKIIDYLRPYTWDKSVENFSKSVLYLTKGYRPTIIHSEYYKKRFLSNIKKYFFYYIPLYTLKKKNVFKIASRNNTFSIVNLNENHPYKNYFFYFLFNIIIRYYNNDNVYNKYFYIDEKLNGDSCFTKNLYSQKNIFAFLNYYLKEYATKYIEEKKKKDKNNFHLYFSNVNIMNSYIYETYSNYLKNQLIQHDKVLDDDIAASYNYEIKSKFIYPNKEFSSKNIYENEHFCDPIFPYYALEKYKTLNSNNNNFSIIDKNDLYYVKNVGIPDKINYLFEAQGLSQNFFSIQQSFNKKLYKQLKKKFYKKITELQIKILKKLQKNRLYIENISYYVNNNVYIEMNDINMHYTNINYLDAFNIYNICGKKLNKGRKKKDKKKEELFLYIPSYFLFILNKK